MTTTRGPYSGDNAQNGARTTAREKISDATPPISRAEPGSPLTPREEAELDRIFGEYDGFVNSISRPNGRPFDPCRAVLPLREALKSANLLVDCMRQSKLPDDTHERGELREQVLDCEERAADLIGRLARLRRGLKAGRAAPAS